MKIQKVIGVLPSTLEPDTAYFVRVGSGFRLWVTDSNSTPVERPLEGDYAPSSLTPAFILSQSLPGFPVTNGLTLAFIPSLSTSTIDFTDFNNPTITAITDSGTGLTLNATGIQPPLLKFSDVNKFHYMETDGATRGLRLDDFPISSIVSADGHSGSIVCISTLNVQAQFNFGWYKKNGTNNYNSSRRYGVHFPWSDSKLYFDFGSSSNGRISVNQPANMADDLTIRTIILRSSATTQEINVDNNSLVVGNPVGSFANGGVNEIGHLGFGFNVNNAGVPQYWSKMRCFAFLFYNRALTDEEISKINEWKNRSIGSTY